jgi:predicted small lipoprotein YifL
MAEGPLFDSPERAFAHLVDQLGGSGRVGPLLYPGKGKRAPQHLNDCLNPDEREKLTLGEMLLLLKMGREAGCHVALHYLDTQAGYKPAEPLVPVDELVDLHHALQKTVSEAQRVLERIERATNAAVRVAKRG